MPAPVIHHLNCGTMCPRGQRLINGHGSWLGAGTLVCHVLLVETAAGLVLVDTGFGTADVRRRQHMDRTFKALTAPRLDLSETAISQLRERGHEPSDVRHIVLTHLDIDHGGGLPDFPEAQVHVFAREYQTMLDPPRRERRRYAISASHWAHGPRWITHEAGEEWLGFQSVRVLPDSEAEILLIPLPGHTLGHVGVAVRQAGGWLLHCGDAYFYRGEMHAPPHCPGGLRAFQNLVGADGTLRRQNQERLRELALRRPGEVRLICSHDPVELERAQAAQPAPAAAQ